MNNKAHTILVSVIASYGSRLTASTANCKAFLADYLSEYTEEKDVLVELHQLQLTKALSTFKGGAINKKTLVEFIEQLETRSQIAMHDLAWGVDAWANAIDLEIKARRMIRKQCFANAVRDLHMVTIRSIEAAPEEVPEVPAMVVENANQAAFPRVALMGVATLVSTFSIFQAVKSMLPSDPISEPTAIVQPVVIKESPVAVQQPLPKLVVIKPRNTEVPIKKEASQLGQSEAIEIEQPSPIDIEKLSGKYLVEEAKIITPDISIDFAEAKIDHASPIESEKLVSQELTKELEIVQPLLQAEDDKLHADIEAFLTQKQ